MIFRCGVLAMADDVREASRMGRCCPGDVGFDFGDPGNE